MFKRIATPALILGMVATGSSSVAQSACGPRDQFVTKLADTYGETRTGSGLNGTTSVLEIWSSADSGTRTILMTDANGVTCVLAAGEYWQEELAMPRKNGAPT